MRQTERARLGHIIEPAWRDIDQSTSGAIWAQGVRLPLEQAIQYALNRPPPQVLSARN
jgi:hypothetical protein